MNKKLIVTISIIVLILIGYYFRYTPFFYIQKFYDYRINKCIKTGKFLDAEKLYGKKLHFCLSTYDKEMTIKSFIRFCVNQRIYLKAEELYLLKLNSNMFHSVYGSSNIGLELNKANIYNEMSGLYINMNNFKKADELSNKALQEIKNSKTTDKSILGEKLNITYKNLGYINLKSGNLTKAKKYFDMIKKTSIEYGMYQQNGEEALFDYYAALMLYYFKIKDYNNAEGYAKKLYISTPKTVLPEDTEWLLQSRYLIFINQNLGKIYYAQRRYKDSERAFSISYKISNELNGEYSPDTVCNAYYLDTTYKAQNRNRLHQQFIKKTKQNIKNFKTMQNTNPENFEKDMDRFCEFWR